MSKLYSNFDSNLITCEDHDLYRVWTSQGAKVNFLRKKIAKYRLNSGGITTRNNFMLSGEFGHLSKLLKDPQNKSDSIKFFERITTDYKIENFSNLDFVYDHKKIIDNLDGIDDILFINLDRSIERKKDFDLDMGKFGIKNYQKIHNH